MHIESLLVALALTVLVAPVQAQPASVADGMPDYQVACSIQGPSGMQACDEQPPARSCDSEPNDASQPSRETTGIALVNRGEQPVKVYWLNFQGQRVLYDKFLPPGGQLTQPTFIGHNWLVATLSEQCVGIFKTAPVAVVSETAVSTAPPPIPDYEQPPPPQEDLAWTPGYWAWSEDSNDYYWVPGTWMAAPIVGYLWTPGYWVVQHDAFLWRAGYWGPHVGFYGGINYGYGYFGRGYLGGSWQNGRMTYSQPAANAALTIRASYNGNGGINARPSATEFAAANEHHIPATAAQLQQVHSAHNNPDLRAGFNNGHPPIGATSRPGEGLSGSAPYAHSGTLSVMHSTVAAVSARPTPGQPLSQPVHAQSQPRAQQPQTRVVHTPVEPQQTTQPETHTSRQNPAPSRPRPVTHAEPHSP
jgi:hypothetical protein